MEPTAEPLDWSLLTRYLTGELSPAERATVERWFEADARHRELLDELRATWTVAGGEVAGWDTEGAVARLRDRQAANRERVAPPGFALRQRRSWVGLAAGLAALAAGAGVMTMRVSQQSPTAVERAPLTDVATRRAQQAEVRLADGSRVILGAASKLSYASDFGRHDRTVVLDGEAYFDVVHDDSKPFRVRTARGVAEDIGTAFVVRSHRGTPLQVVVTNGAVVLRPSASSSRDTLLLTAGQLGRVLSDGELVFRSRVDTSAYLAWTRGHLVFEDAPLTDVSAELSRWYDADVRVADSTLAGRHFSGRFERRTLEQAVQIVAAVADVSVRRTDAGWVFAK